MDDDADVFKQWGPLAFAVAAADRPQLQTGGSKAGNDTRTQAPKPTLPTRSKSGLLFWSPILLFVVAIIVGGAILAWKYQLLAR
jgi:hypothetical protein